ncbi:MAG: M3 family metallopeptidase, partial [Prevotella sp.]|nr:M3 family metallopeptidase [Prevotella sp.]
RELRERMYKGYISRGCRGGANDNRDVVKRLVKARLEKARLMGFPNYAAMALDTRMAKTPKDVYELLDQVWTPALAKAKEELADVEAEMAKDGRDFVSEGWDWRYYADRAKRAKYSFDENELRPYLKLENVRDGLFYCANKLYGITLKPLSNVPLPHPDAQAFEVFDRDGSRLAILFMDFFPRASKRGGAWCGTYRDQTYENGKKVIPIVTVVCNFSKPAAGEPALLNADETSTMFHEFGHALHQFFQNVHYQGVSNVPRDFVELPSQVNEHWAFAPEVLKVYAKHYKTGEVMPQSLVEKLDRSSKYGQGFASTEYLAASLLDMDFHVLENIPDDFDVMEFERKTLVDRGLLNQIPSRYRTTYFNHTMGGGYTAGYYSYIWAEVLEADAFNAYQETGDIFNQEVAAKFRKHILTPGGINEAMDMYVNFRGKKPSIEPLLKNRGLK